MTAELSGALNAFKEYIEPRDGLSNNPFRLGCSFGPPATTIEIKRSWPGGGASAKALEELWLLSRESRLFEDLDFGQWGLRLLPPEEALARTEQQRSLRPLEFREGDIVFGEFLGDLELLVLSCDAFKKLLVSVALPLDVRRDWPQVGSSIAEFLRTLLAASGEKFWEN